MKIWHISDTHTYHNLLNVPSGIDMFIHSGDCSNPRDPYNNEPEVRNFIHWFKSLPIKKPLIFQFLLEIIICNEARYVWV
jgi:predicted phosphodiesterase